MTTIITTNVYLPSFKCKIYPSIQHYLFIVPNCVCFKLQTLKAVESLLGATKKKHTHKKKIKCNRENEKLFMTTEKLLHHFDTMKAYKKLSNVIHRLKALIDDGKLF